MFFALKNSCFVKKFFKKNGEIAINILHIFANFN